MKKKYGILAAMMAAALLAAAGCGGSAAETAADTADSGSTQNSSAAMTEEAWEEMSAVEDTAAAADGEVFSSSGIDSVGISEQKLIKTVDLAMETREFDTLLENIRAKTEECGGYVESQNISGLSYYNSDDRRYAWMTLRIPADRLDEFVTVISGFGNVTSRNESVQDVTLEYVDVESHIEALETEQNRLMELMERAENMEDIITIENRLSEIRYELQSYESTRRTYDNQVDYSTVSINIDEVERETTPQEDRSFFGEIRVRLSDNFYEIGRGIRGFGIWFISSLPYLALIFAGVWIGVRLIQKIVWKKPFFRRRKERAPRETGAEDGAAQENTKE